MKESKVMSKHHVSSPELRSYWGITLSTLSQYVLEGMPKIADNVYDLVECWQWKDRLQEERSGRTALTFEQTRHARAQADLKEVTLAKERGEIMTLDEVKNIWSKLILAFKGKILILPTKLPSRIAACQNQNEVRELLDEACRECLTELNQMDARSFVPTAKVRRETDFTSLR